MNWLFGLLIFILLIIAACAAFLGILTLLYYLLCGLLNHWAKPGNIRQMRNFPEGTIYTAHSKAATEAFMRIAPVFEFWEDPHAEELTVRTGSELADRINASKKVLADNRVQRHIRFVDLRITQQKNGSNYRRWNDSGKEWQACQLSGAMLETYTGMDGSELTEPVYFDDAALVFTMSRRLREEEAASAEKKDMWGRKASQQKNYYQDLVLKDCPSCGATLPQNLKDAVCPSCGATIFADYYDWQIEAIEIEPQTTRKTLIDMIRGRKPGQKTINKKKGSRNKRHKIVRFSENDFRKDVLEACRNEVDADRLIDLFLGDLKIRSVRNTETQTILGISVKTYKTIIDEKQQVLSQTETMQADFARPRYPDRFDKESAVISDEKDCPNCGGPFSPDEKGNCTYCGTFLFKDNLKWKKC